MFEKWNTFVYELKESKRKDIEEEPYHEQIEAQMQLLGWAKWRGEICHKENVPIGRGHIQPDIIIKKDGEVQFVIEVKRPVYSQTSKDVGQLVSYIRQMKTQVGIYIGEHIEIFYDKKGQRDGAISVQIIPLELDNKRGARFVEIFARENFTENSVIEFCEQCIEEKQRQESLNKIKEGLIADVQQQVTEALQPYLSEKYNGKFNEEEIQSMLSTIRFSAATDGAIPPVGKAFKTKQTTKKNTTIIIPTSPEIIEDEKKVRLLSLATLPSYLSNLKSDIMRDTISDLGLGKDIADIKDIEQLEHLKVAIREIEKSRNMHNTHSCALSKYIEYIKEGMGLQDMEHDVRIIKSSKLSSKLVSKGNVKHNYHPQKRNQRPPFDFSMIGLKKDDKIIFDPLDIEVAVFDSKRIIYEGNTYTLSGFCRNFLPDSFRIKSDAYQGPKYFSFQGKTLWRIRLGKEQPD